MPIIEKTTFLITVLHTREERPAAPSLQQIAYELSDGAWVGQVEQLKTVRVPKARVKKELLAIGNDGEFFDFA